MDYSIEMNPLQLWIWASAAAGAYCLIRAIRDIRQKHYVWGAFGLLSAAVFLLMPVPTMQAIKIDLPARPTGK